MADTRDQFHANVLAFFDKAHGTLTEKPVTQAELAEWLRQIARVVVDTEAEHLRLERRVMNLECGMEPHLTYMALTRST